MNHSLLLLWRVVRTHEVEHNILSMLLHMIPDETAILAMLRARFSLFNPARLCYHTKDDARRDGRAVKRGGAP